MPSSPETNAPAPTVVEGRTSIVIVAYGQRAVSERCLELIDETIGHELGDRYELVLVDNNSPDDTAELFRQWRHRAVVLLQKTNTNFSGGCNAGAAAASGDVIVFLNNDVDLVAGALDELVEAVREDGVGAVGARLVYPDGALQHGGVAMIPRRGVVIPHHMWHYQADDLPVARASYEVDCVTGACLVIRRSVFEEIGGFDLGYANGWEDVDLCLKVRVAGHRIVYRGDVVLVHREGATRGRQAGMDANGRYFYAVWEDIVAADTELAAEVFDCRLQPDRDNMLQRTEPVGPVVVGGHLSGPSPSADEGRALLAALEAAGMLPAAAERMPAHIQPRLDAEEWALIERCALRGITTDTVFVHVHDGCLDVPTGDATVVRLAAMPVRGLAGAPLVWAASPALVDELVSGGLHPEAVELLPPPVAGIERGPGGNGLLVHLPAHDRPLLETVLDALAPITGVDVRLVPNVLTRGLEQLVAERLPGAELLPACAVESHFAALAASADAALCIDLDDGFQRRALVAAAAGAAPVALAGGAAGHVLGERLATPAEISAAAVRTAVEAALSSAGERSALAAAVAAECGPQALSSRLRELVTAGLMADRLPAPERA